MNCKVCGATVKEGASFCHECGAAVKRESKEESLRSLVAVGQKIAEQKAQTERTPPEPVRQEHVRRSYAPPSPQGPPNPGIRANMMGPNGVRGDASSELQGRKRPRNGFLTLALCGVCLVGSFVFEVIGAVIGSVFGLDLDFVTTGCGALGACVGILAMRGSGLLKPTREAFVEAWNEGGWWVIATACALLVFEIVDYAMTGWFSVASDWPVRVMGTLVLCLLIGLSEEGAFRGLIYGGLLDAFGGGRKGLFAAAIVSAALFGAAHVEWWALDYGDGAQLLQALLKILQTGTYGFFLAALTTRTKSLLGPALIHGLDDFILLVISVGFMGDALETEYVTTGAEAASNIVVYVIVILLYAPLVLQGIRMLKEAELPERGPFHRP